jgi:hypothetical protein
MQLLEEIRNREEMLTSADKKLKNLLLELEGLR